MIQNLVKTFQLEHPLQLLILVAIIVALVALIRIELMGGRKRKKKKKRRKRSSSNLDMVSRSDALDAVLEGIGEAFRDLKEESRIMAVEYEPLKECPAEVGVGHKNSTAERCARWSWTSAGGLNKTLLPPIEAFGQECF